MNYYKKSYINTVLKFLMIYTLLAKTHSIEFIDFTWQMNAHLKFFFRKILLKYEAEKWQVDHKLGKSDNSF